jgi:hypothetical protein
MIAVLAISLLCSVDLSGFDLVQRGKVHWSRLDGGEQVSVLIAGGIATRNNPNWKPQPEKLAYDLDRNRELERALKGAHLGASIAGRQGTDARTLEIDVQDRNGEWRSAGKWTLPLKRWRKGKLAAIYDLLEPLLSVRPELFETIPQKDPEPQ